MIRHGIITLVSAGIIASAGCDGDGRTMDGGLTGSDADRPGADAGPARSARVFAGQSACAVRADGEVRCWGGHTYGELGIGDAAPDLCGDPPEDPCALSPVVVPEWFGAVDIDINYGLGCAVLEDGRVRCAGRNDYGQLGNGETAASDVRVTTPVDVTLSGPAVQVVAGSSFACALLADGTVSCWGSDRSAQIAGQGIEACGLVMNRPCAITPLSIPGLSDVIDIGGAGSIVGEGHMCAVLGDGTVRCWGDGRAQQLGSEPVPLACNEGLTECLTTPTPVTGVSGAVEVDCNTAHCCARTDAGSVMCWGRGAAGKLGDGTVENRALAVSVTGLDSAVQIATGLGHTCARRADGTIACWGRNASGELGLPLDSSDLCGEPGREEPCMLVATDLPGISAVWMSARGNNTCAVTAGDTVQCWGTNFTGNLGIGIEDDEAHPTPSIVP